MTSQFDFTNNEWNDIAALPVLLGFAVAKAEDSGMLGNFREIRALAHSIKEAAPANAAQALIEAASLVDVRDKLNEFEGHSAEILADVAVISCAAIAGVLDGKAQPAEARAYKQWVYDVAYEVASAAKEHGVRVSPSEVALLDRAKMALRL